MTTFGEDVKNENKYLKFLIVFCQLRQICKLNDCVFSNQLSESRTQIPMQERAINFLWQKTFSKVQANEI